MFVFVVGVLIFLEIGNLISCVHASFNVLVAPFYEVKHSQVLLWQYCPSPFHEHSLLLLSRMSSTRSITQQRQHAWEHAASSCCPLPVASYTCSVKQTRECACPLTLLHILVRSVKLWLTFFWGRTLLNHCTGCPSSQCKIPCSTMQAVPVNVDRVWVFEPFFFWFFSSSQCYQPL